MTASIVVDGVSHWYGPLIALSEVSFSIGPGVTALLGPNGAGKSTLVKLLCGLAAPRRGVVRVLDRDPRADLGVLRHIGLVPQSEALFESLSAVAFVSAAAELARLPEPAERAADALHLVQLDPTDRRPVSSYSKGMRQRVKVAQALVHDPDIVVLDEPLDGLDPRQRVQLIALFRELGEAGKTVLVSSHVLEEVGRFGSNVLVLSEGRLVAEGDFRGIRDLMDDRPHRFVVETDRPAELGARLLTGGAVVGVAVTGERRMTVDTETVQRFRRDVVAAARGVGARLYAVESLDDDLDSVFRYLVDRRTRNAR